MARIDQMKGTLYNHETNVILFSLLDFKILNKEKVKDREREAKQNKSDFEREEIKN